jgi:hypothetical protein
MCYDLGIEFEDVSGETKPAKALGLIQYLDRRNRLHDLANLMQQQRPNADWAWLGSLGLVATDALDAQSATVQQTIGGRGNPLRPSYQTSTELGPIADRWALLVGINKYTDRSYPELKYCIRDVEAMKTVLEGYGYNVIMLHDEMSERHLRPTKNNIIAELVNICSAARRDDLIFVQFACHGENVKGEPMLITEDTRESAKATQALAVAEVERLLKESQAQRFVVVLDACHVGVKFARGLGDPEFIKNVNDKAHGFVLFAGSTAQQKAQEWDAEQHGVFTAYLLKGLAGEAQREGEPFITVDSLKDFVLDGLRKWRVKNSGLAQEPTVRAETMGNMVLADFRKYKPRKA